MTLSEIRRRIDALKRKFARELAIIKLRRIADAGFRLPTFARLSRYLKDTQRQREVPDAESIVLNLLPWAGNDRYRELLRWDLPSTAP